MSQAEFEVLFAAWRALYEKANRQLQDSNAFAEFLEEVSEDCTAQLEAMRSEGAIE